MAEVILDDKAQSNRGILADDADGIEPLFGNTIDYAGKNLVLQLPPMQQSGPGLALIALSLIHIWPRT